MADLIRYDILVRDALRDVLRQVLNDAAKRGLPGEHHFCITFLTKAPGVKLPERMLQQFPEEMTIILQHMFWDLQVGSNEFSVGLTFGGVSERVTVPFAAIKGFADPSVSFGLQFETSEISADEKTPEEKKPTAPAPESIVDTIKVAEKAADAAPAAEPQGAEIVRLDRFRKK